MTLNELNEQTRERQFSNYCWNSVVNHPRISKQFEKERPCVSTLPHVQNMPVIICGSGPSLDEAAPYLSQWRGSIFCSPSQLMVLEHCGATPAAIFVDDTNDDGARMLKEYYGNAWTTLITHPCVDSKILEAWKGPVYYFLELYQSELDKLQATIYPFIRMRLGAAGCVTNLMIHMAALMGYSPIIIAGIDLTDVDGQTRATPYKKHGMYSLEQLPRPTHSVLHDKEDRANGVSEIDRLVFEYYYYTLMCLWKIYNFNLISVSKGIVDCPKITFEQLLAGQFPRSMKPHEVAQKVDAITIPHGIYGYMEQGQPVVEFAEKMPKPNPWTQENGLWKRQK